MPATITAQTTGVTLINVYEVEPETQKALTDLISRLTEETIRHRPGFISVNIHASLDGTRVVNYAQWASQADFQAFVTSPEAQTQVQQFAALAKSVSPALYRVEAVHTA